MLVGLLSDTHIPVPGTKLWPELMAAFEGVDLILHAGDIIVPKVLDDLEAVAPVLAAEGNHDGGMADDHRVEKVHRLELEGFDVAMLHLPDPLEVGMERMVRQYLGKQKPDILVSGDSHIESIDFIDGCLLVNSGSATLPRNMAPRLGHIGFLRLEKGHPPEAWLVDLATGETVAQHPPV